MKRVNLKKVVGILGVVAMFLSIEVLNISNDILATIPVSMILWGEVNINPQSPTLDSVIELRIRFNSPMDIPVSTQYYIPWYTQIIEIKNGKFHKQKSESGMYTVIKWEGNLKKYESCVEQIIKFKITKPGFYKIFGSMHSDSPIIKYKESRRELKAYYIQISKKDGRIEDWDFSSLKNRLLHFFGLDKPKRRF